MEQINTWYSVSLGDGMWAPTLTAQIEEMFLPLFGEAGKPVDMAVFTRSESEGRLHCEVIAYFSPAAWNVAKAFDAEPCEKPFRDGLGLLAGDLNSWAVFFPKSNPDCSREFHVKIKAANTILYCKKWQETVGFYSDGLKLLVISSNDWFVEFKLNERSRLSVANEARTSIDSGDGKGITISLQVDDIEQLQAELLEAGITSTPIKEVWGSKAIYIHDPEGNRLEFWMGRAKA